MTPFEKACSYIGLKEVVGEKHNPIILNFFKVIGHEWVQADETAWCAAFVNYCCHSTIGKSTRKLNARSFLYFGQTTTKPAMGDIVVLWRENPDSWKGHVGFYMNHDDEFVYVLGGNQSNQVKVSKYPLNQVLEYKMVHRV